MQRDYGFDSEWGVNISPRILLPLRGYKEEIYAAYFALLLSQTTGAKLISFHVDKVVDKDKYDYWGLIDKITPIATQLGVDWEKIEIRGESARVETIKHITEVKYDLIVLGTQRTQGFPSDLRTSNAITLASQTNRPPVIVVQSPHKKEPKEFTPPVLEKIIFPFNNGDVLDNYTVKLSSLFMSSAGKGDRKLLALKVVKVPSLMPPSSAREFLTEIEAQFLRNLRKYSVLGMPISPRIVIGHSWVKTMTYMLKQEKPSLSIIGVRGKFSQYGRKMNPIWRISRNAKVPIIFIFMSDEQEGTL